MDDERPESLEDAARMEQHELWQELLDAIVRDFHGDWSIKCTNIAWRITNLARFVGATPWEQIQVRLLRSGVYERVLTEAGIDYPPIDWVRVAEVEAGIAARKTRLRLVGS